MLRGLRRKLGRYAPVGGVKGAYEEGGEQERRLKENATPMEVAVWHFDRQERALRRLETEIRQMLDQVQGAFASMATVAEIFSDTCSEEEEDSCGEDYAYKAAMKQIEQEDVERMKQSIRFTVLDPLQARLERYDQLNEEIYAWSKLTAELKTLRALTLRMHSSRLEDDEKRMHTETNLHRVAALLHETETELLPLLEDAVQSGATNMAALFKTTRLQTAIFFRNGNHSVRSSLSPPEQEIVAEVNRAFKLSAAMRYNPSIASLSSRLSKLSSLASDTWTEMDRSSSSTALDGAEGISGSDEDDENNLLSMSVEDFDAGSVSRAAKLTETGAKGEQANRSVDSLKLVDLATYPEVTQGGHNKRVRRKDADGERLRRSTSPSPQSSRLKPATPRRAMSMLSSIRKTIQGKLSYANGEMRTIGRSPVSMINSSAGGSQCGVHSPLKLCIIPPSSTEWLAIEEFLWELDLREAKSSGNSLLQTDSIGSDADDILSRLLQKHDSLYYECLSYLRIEDLARLSKVNFRIHSRLVDNAPIWKKCIRSGGLSPSVRSSLWLAVFYESTPWRSSGIAPHHLSADRRRSMFDQLLAKVGTKVADEAIAGELPLIDDDAQLADWFREIDVDVVRTCHRSIHANVVPRASSTQLADDSSDECLVGSVLNDVVNNVATTGEEETLASNNSYRGSCSSSSDARTSDLEAKIRRVLRAYVVYNPRVGYCQGMGFLVRLLAEVVHDEADIFWLFVGFSEPENDQNLYEPGMAVLQPYLSKFELLFSAHMSELYAHFQAEGVQVATFCTRWFLTFFSSFETLAPMLVTRLLDIFIIDGWRIMFSVSLVILNELQQQLLKCDMEGILRILRFPRSYMPEPDQHRQRQLVRHALAFSVSRDVSSI